MSKTIIEENVRMETLTTYKLKGIVKKVIYPLNEKSLIKIINELKSKNEKFIILGNGSNIIFKDEYYAGTIIKLTKINNLKINKNIITVDAGYSLIKLCHKAKENNLSGLEELSGIPATIGGAIYQNASAYNKSISQLIEELTVLKDNKIVKIKKEELKFGYRKSIFKKNKNYIILSAKLKLAYDNKTNIEQKMKEFYKKRLKKQPYNYPSAGSVFKNPKNNYAGKIIEEQGLKGMSVSGAYVSEKHANFIVNKQSCTGKDIITLIKIIKQKVKKETNINLKLEQEIIK